MVKFWQLLRGKQADTRKEAFSVQVREVAEAKRQELERAMAYRKKEVNGLVEGVLPNREAEQ